MIAEPMAASFEQEYHDLLTAGLPSTPYQQTDDTSARVRGESWHTQVLYNPFYTAYSTRASKDLLTVLSVMQNTDDSRFRFNGLSGAPACVSFPFSPR